MMDHDLSPGPGSGRRLASACASACDWCGLRRHPSPPSQICSPLTHRYPMATQKTYLVISALGEDHPGIVNQLSKVILEPAATSRTAA